MPDSQNENTHKLLIIFLPGGSGVRTFRHLPPWSPAEGGRKGAGDILHHTVHRHLQEGRPKVGSRLKFKFENIYFDFFLFGRTVSFDVPPQEVSTKGSLEIYLREKNLIVIWPTSVLRSGQRAACVTAAAIQLD